MYSSTNKIGSENSQPLALLSESMNSFEIPSAVDHFEAMINEAVHSITEVYFMSVCA